MTKHLAIIGGSRTVTTPAPHFVWPPVGEDVEQAVLKQLRTGELSVYGRAGIIKKFEDEFLAYHGAKYAIATCTGTLALHSAFFGCGIGPGDEVIAPTYTFHATTTPILHCGAIPVLCEADPLTGNMDPAAARKLITKRTKAIVVTHMWGHPADMDELVALAREHGLYLIEDCSHAHGATYKGKKVGTFGDVAAFSLQGNKMVYAGEGGILITDNQEIYERATLLGHFRDRADTCVTSEFYSQFSKTGYGLKYRIHVLGAAIALASLRRLDERIQTRKENLEYFNAGIQGIPGVRPPFTHDYVTRGAWYGYKPFYVADEMGGVPIEMYIKALQAEGLEVHKPGSPPLHLYALFQTVQDGMYNNGWPRRGEHVEREYVYAPGDFPNAERYYAGTLSLPTFTEPSFALIDQYVAAFRKIAEHKDELIAYYEQTQLERV